MKPGGPSDPGRHEAWIPNENWKQKTLYKFSGGNIGYGRKEPIYM